jgi:hypothetical protein
MSGFPEKIAEIAAQAWERGKYFLWAIACAGAVVFAVLLAGKRYDLGNAAILYDTYGVAALLVGIVASILAGWRTIEGRTPPSVHLIPDDQQSFWSQCRQPNGNVTTQFCFRMQATNLAGHNVKLSALRLTKPRLRRNDEMLACHLLTRHPFDNTYGFEFPIHPRAVSRASGDVIVNRAVGTPRTRMTAVIKVSDQRGRWHKVKFRRLRSVSQQLI